jgi:hypothetical protein
VPGRNYSGIARRFTSRGRDVVDLGEAASDRGLGREEAMCRVE